MKVLIAVDGSECSTKAVKHCQELTWPTDTEFEVITVLDYTNHDSSSIDPQSESTSEAQLLIDSHVSALQKTHPQFKFAKTVLEGYTKGRIVDHSIESRADLIVVGSHGRTGFEKLLLGSVSQAVLCHALCPVRIVRNGHDESHTGLRVILCLDDSKYSQFALERLLSYKWPLGTEFTCFTVLNSMLPVGRYESTSPTALQIKERQEKFKKQTKLHLDEASRKIEEKIPGCIVKAVTTDGDAREEILNLANSIDADLVLMGSHGRALLDRLLLGSVSEAVAHHANCSVEVVRHKI